MSRAGTAPRGTLLLLSAAASLWVMGCSKAPTGPQVQTPDAAVPISVATGVSSPTHSSETPGDGGLILRGLGLRKGLELLPFKEGRLLSLIGKRDETNLYASTVLVEGEFPVRLEGCSGVLIHPRLVLTAAHCACEWRRESSIPAEGSSAVEEPSCAKRAQVTALVHVPSAESPEPTLSWQVQEGTIRIHPDFELRLGSKAEARASHADLAVILLEKPITLDVPEVYLPTAEVRMGESLVTVGFGNEPGLPQIHGARYFRQGRITQVFPAQDGRVLYEPAGAYLNTSYLGGPCFVERGKNRWLVGIVGLGTDQEMSFTSIDSHLSWVRAELEQAARSPVPQEP